MVFSVESPSFDRTSPILLLALEATLTALVFLECPRALGPCGLIGERIVGFTCPSAVLLRPDVGAIDKFGRADAFAMGSAAAASCENSDNLDSCPSGSVSCDEKPSEVEVGGVSWPLTVDCEFDTDCRPNIELIECSWLSPTDAGIVSVPSDRWEEF